MLEMYGLEAGQTKGFGLEWPERRSVEVSLRDVGVAQIVSVLDCGCFFERQRPQSEMLWISL